MFMERGVRHIRRLLLRHMSRCRAVTLSIADNIIVSTVKSWKPQANGATKLRKCGHRAVSTDKFIDYVLTISHFKSMAIDPFVSERLMEGMIATLGIWAYPVTRQSPSWQVLPQIRPWFSASTLMPENSGFTIILPYT